MANSTVPHDPLAALGAYLGARRLEVELTARGLRVRNPDGRGCCDEAPVPSVLITCRPRPDDSGRLWYWTSWNEPIAEAERVVDATVLVLGRLAGREEGAQ
ncbi:hypothetical protein [Actinomadura sp. WAC 06369]|uniref:hypothetical protein n=1 Tax=Actinomadura sp. WAC 06369 TaxID=2203193 RepID=UPI000F7BADA8|nr:hypothetical protein [Actinomadura sp. WAC 06369]